MDSEDGKRGQKIEKDHNDEKVMMKKNQSERIGST